MLGTKMRETDRRAVISGMAVNTPLGDDLDTFYQGLIAGKSAISRWRSFDAGSIYSKVGGDLSGYDARGKLALWNGKLPTEIQRRLRRLVKKAPLSTRIALLCAVDAILDAGLAERVEPTRTAIVVAGHDLHNNLLFSNAVQFIAEPDYIDPLLPVYSLDTDVAASISEALGVLGAVYTVGGACASGNIALRSALFELWSREHDVVLVVGAPFDFSPPDLHAMAIMGAISHQSFNHAPERASRPFDRAREGFIPAHGAGVLVVERLSHALERGARIHAEVLGVAMASDGSHLPTPSVEGQTRAMRRLLRASATAPEEVDYINAHATSTPLGDVTEINSIKAVFGDHASRLKINATKSMTGHTMWAAPLVETVAALLQMNRGVLHPSINIDSLDLAVDLDVCADGPVKHEVRCLMKNAFGFGGINCCALYRSIDAPT